MEHKSTSIADQVFAILERDILSGEYQRGEILTEKRLTEKLEVSRTPVREALKRLEQEHLIEMTGRGALVVGISPHDIDIIFEMRFRLEGLAVRMAVANFTQEDIKELTEILELQEFYTGKIDPDNIKNADSNFHHKIYQMSKCAPLCDTLWDLHKKIIKYRKASLTKKSRADNSLAEHKAILEAIINKDADLAEEMLLSHISNARDNLKC